MLSYCDMDDGSFVIPQWNYRLEAAISTYTVISSPEKGSQASNPYFLTITFSI